MEGRVSREMKKSSRELLPVAILRLEKHSVSRGREKFLFCVSKRPWGAEKVSILLCCIPNWNSLHCFWVVM